MSGTITMTGEEYDALHAEAEALRDQNRDLRIEADGWFSRVNGVEAKLEELRAQHSGLSERHDVLSLAFNEVAGELEAARGLLERVTTSFTIEAYGSALHDARQFLAAAPAPSTVKAEQGTTSDQYRAELYDEVWEKARGMGYGNVTDALVDLERMKAAPSLPAAGSADQPYPEGIAEDLERSDWTPLEALQWYAAGKHFDVVGGRTRIIDTGAVASNALKHASLDRPELKGDAELSELRAALSAHQSAPVTEEPSPLDVIGYASPGQIEILRELPRTGGMKVKGRKDDRYSEPVVLLSEARAAMLSLVVRCQQEGAFKTCLECGYQDGHDEICQFHASNRNQQQSAHVSVPMELLERVESHLDRTTFAPFGEPLPPDNTERRELRDNIRALLNGGEA